MSIDYSIQIASASVSFVASVVIIIMIKRARLVTPYRRLIFGLSTGEAIHSLGMITGPFAPPKGLFLAPWGQGNTMTCDANGFLNAFGATVVILYLLFLSVYLHYKLKKRMSDPDFSVKIERKMHIALLIYSSGTSIAALATKSMNPIPTGAICLSARYPPACAIIPDVVGECTRGLVSMYFTYIFAFINTCTCLVMVTIIMILLMSNAYYIEKIHRLDPNGLVQERSGWINCFACIFCWLSDDNQMEGESHADYVLRLYRRETIVQGLLYIGSFALSHVMTFVVTILNLMGITIPGAVRTLISLLYPLMGFFNILIYCRPKVKMFRLTHPHFSWVRSFLLVVKAGGEVPVVEEDPHALRVCCCCHPNQRSEREDPEYAARQGGSSYLESLLIRAGLIGM